MKQDSHPRLARNNFDFLRLMFAATVCLVHASELSGFLELRWIGGVLSSGVAVNSFFVVSGFLIFMSYERSRSLLSYAGKRFRRIYPAYFAVIILSAFGLILFSSHGITDYFSSGWMRYFVANLVFLNFLQPSLPGVFEGNNLSAVNGALWTLKIEVMFYLSVPILVYLFRKFNRLAMLVVLYLASIGYAEWMLWLAESTGSGFYTQLARQLPGQLCYFLAGAGLYYYLPYFERRVGYFVVFALMVYLLGENFFLAVFEPLALGVLVVFFGLFFYLGNFGKYGDFSYGLYILHFPVIQMILTIEWFGNRPWFFLSAVLVVSMIGAVAMWHLVEKRFLLRSSHYVIANQEKQ